MTNQKYQARVLDLDYKGDGIVLLGNQYIYIKGALKGELISFKIDKINEKYGFGTLIKIIEKSSERVSSVSPLGSLNMAHLSFKAELEFKRQITRETFRKAFNANFDVFETITDYNDCNYRNKVTFHVMKNEEISLGLYLSSTKKLVRVDDLIIANQKSNELLKTINSSKINVDYQTLKHLMIKNNEKNELLVTLVATKSDFKGLKELKKLITSFDNVLGLTLNINQDSNKILGAKSYLLSGVSQLTYQNLLITDQSFMQVNYGVMELVFNLIKENITGEKIVDLYSGIGSIIYSVINKNQQGVMVESNLANILLAKKIKNNYEIKNVDVIHNLSEAYIIKEDIDTLIVDPPRSGLYQELVLKIKNSNIQKLIYLSCNLQTLIRDIKLLDNNYRIDKIYPINMFPKTNALETLVILTKNK